MATINVNIVVRYSKGITIKDIDKMMLLVKQIEALHIEKFKDMECYVKFESDLKYELLNKKI